jgi:hypothetical protein
MPDETEKHFSVLCQIQRAQHFAWREAVAQLGADAGACVDRMWEVTGRETARAYAKRLDPSRPLAPQVAECIVWSSRCMGEDAVVESPTGDSSHGAFVRHRACPWFEWHQKMGLLEEDRRGCDIWFSSVMAELNRALGTRLRCETLGTLPEGNASCLRRIWQDKEP